ncbi:MAG: DUF4349 domain-containing protein, partial [Saprospiraceae bacterium]|nr:DUF4349 domain-containing protein [Saprospiraceae bacterium]
PDDGQTSGEAEPQTADRKLIKNGRIGFQTDDLEKTYKAILKHVEQYNAYVSSDENHNNYGQLRHEISVRIPSKNFDTFVAAVEKGVKEFDYREIQTQDVTAEYLDVEARIKAKKEMENRYLAILQQAKTVTEMLEIERQLGEVRGEIESMEGRLRLLKNQVSFSTLNISFYKEIPYQGDSFWTRLGDSFRSGWDNLLLFIVGIVHLWPFLILIGFGIWGFRRFRKNRKVRSL